MGKLEKEGRQGLYVCVRSLSLLVSMGEMQTSARCLASPLPPQAKAPLTTFHTPIYNRWAPRRGKRFLGWKACPPTHTPRVCM